MADKADELIGLFVSGAQNAEASRHSFALVNAVARDATLSVRFRELVNANATVNRLQMRNLMKTLAARLERDVGVQDGLTELLDRYVAPVSASSLVAGIIASFVQDWAGGPWVAAIGAFALLVAACTRFWVKNAAISAKHDARLIEMLTDL